MTRFGKGSMGGWLAAAAIVVAGAAQADEPLRIATEGAYPPFNMTNAEGALIGFDVEIAEALCAEMGRECTIVAQDWDGIIPGLVAGRYDAIIASMSITEERLQTVDFSAPYYSNYIAVVAPTGSEVSIESLGEVRVGAQRSTVSSQWAEDTLGSRADISLYDTQTAAYADLQAGRIDALVSDYLPVVDWMGQNEGYALVGDPIDIDDKIGIAVRKGETELADAFSAAILAIRENGVYGEINARYFDVDIY